MSEMTWYQAFDLVNAYLKEQQDEELEQAWHTFLQSPFPHLNGRAGRSVEDFLATAEHFEGKGAEYLVYRLTQVVEQLPAMLGGAPGPGPYLQMVVELWDLVALKGGMGAAVINQIFEWAETDEELKEALLVRKRDQRLREKVDQLDWHFMPVMINGQAVDEAFQTGYCDDCGYELDPDGKCPICNW